MTCDEARERLSDQLLDTLEPGESAAVAAHLRGCAACRTEAAALGDGMAAFASAAHDRTPPEALHSRIEEVLRAEWGMPQAPRPSWIRGGLPWVAVSVALVTLLLTASWGISQRDAATRASSEGASYANLLNILGGKEFRAGRLIATSGRALDGSVVVYDSHEGQSWAAVFVRAPGSAGRATATLDAPDGRTIQIWPMRIQPGGDGASWIVTSADLTAFDHLTVRDAQGAVIATAGIRAA